MSSRWYFPDRIAVGRLMAETARIPVRQTFIGRARCSPRPVGSGRQAPGRISRTVNTQPLMLTADVALYRAWRARRPRAGNHRRTQPRRYAALVMSERSRWGCVAAGALSCAGDEKRCRQAPARWLPSRV
jgi:hypothetical protein